MTLTGPFIDDVAPPASKARWFAWLSLFPSLGVAAGYLAGDLAALTSWRNLFFIEAAVAVPVVLFTLLAPPVRLRGKLAALQAAGGAASPAPRCNSKPNRLPVCLSHLGVACALPHTRPGGCYWHLLWACHCIPVSLVWGCVRSASQRLCAHASSAAVGGRCRACEGLAMLWSAGAPVRAERTERGWAAAARRSLAALWRELVILHRQPVFMANCYGYVPVQATLGVFTFWGPKVGGVLLGISTLLESVAPVSVQQACTLRSR